MELQRPLLRGEYSFALLRVGGSLDVDVGVGGILLGWRGGPFGAGCAAPAAAPAATAVEGATAGVARAAVVVAVVLAGRGAYEGEVDGDGLLEELGLVGVVDGGAGFVEGGVLDQSVALESSAWNVAGPVMSPGLWRRRDREYEYGGEGGSSGRNIP